MGKDTKISFRYFTEYILDESQSYTVLEVLIPGGAFLGTGRLRRQSRDASAGCFLKLSEVLSRKEQEKISSQKLTSSLSSQEQQKRGTMTAA